MPPIEDLRDAGRLCAYTRFARQRALDLEAIGPLTLTCRYQMGLRQRVGEKVIWVGSAMTMTMRSPPHIDNRSLDGPIAMYGAETYADCSAGPLACEVLRDDP